MSTIRPSKFLRWALLADAAASGATAALTIAGASIIDRLLGLPSALLLEAGLILVPYVALVAWLGTRERLAPSAVWAVILANVAWAAASVLLLVSGLVAPTAFGYAFVIAQALAVVLFAVLQYVGFDRQAAAPA